MLTHVTLSAHLVWDEVLWQVVAIYQDSADGEPVALHRSGRASAAGQDAPQAVLAAAVRALESGRVE